VLKHIPHQGNKRIAQIVHSSPELKAYIQQSGQLKTLFSIATKLEGLPRNASTHAAGVIICDDRLQKHVPLSIGSNDLRITQYPMNDLEAIGLLKMDFLGLRNLTLLEYIQTSISKANGISVSIKDIPQDDPKTFTLL